MHNVSPLLNKIALRAVVGHQTTSSATNPTWPVLTSGPTNIASILGTSCCELQSANQSTNTNKHILDIWHVINHKTSITTANHLPTIKHELSSYAA